MVVLSYHIKAQDKAPFGQGDRQLVFEAGRDYSIVMLWNVPMNQPEEIEVFTGIENWSSDWDELTQKSSLLGLSDLETTIFFGTDRVITMPHLFFDQKEAIIQIGQLTGEASGNELLADLHPDMVIAFEVEKEKLALLENHFSILHKKSLAGLMIHLQTDFVFPQSKDHAGWILCAPGMIYFSLWQKDKLLICKVMKDLNPDEVVYNILNACNIWGLAPNTVSWFLNGLLSKDSAFYQLFDRYLVLEDSNEAGLLMSEDVSPHFYAHLAGYMKSS